MNTEQQFWFSRLKRHTVYYRLTFDDIIDLDPNITTNVLLGVYPKGITSFGVSLEPHASKAPDFSNSGTLAYIVSKHVARLLTSASLSGFKCFPLRLPHGQVVESYEGLSITGRCGGIDWSKSNRETLFNEKRGVTDIFRGLHVPTRSWDGSDIFVASDHYDMLLSSKAATVLRESHLTNIEVVSISEFIISTYDPRIASQIRD